MKKQINKQNPVEIPKRENIIHLFEDGGVDRIHLVPDLTEFII